MATPSASQSRDPTGGDASEPWDHLARHRARKESFVAACEAIQAACAKDPGHARTAVADCKACHRKMVDLVSRRYLAAPETEWYADRRTFLQHLAELFPAVRRGEVEASGIEDRVMDEKCRWFREHVRRVALAMGAAGMGEGKEELLALMDDQRLKFPDFCERVKAVVAGALKDGVPDGSLEKLMAAGSDPKARVEAYKEVFFPDGEKRETGESTRKYLEMVEQGVSIAKVAAKVVDDRRQGIADQAQLERLQNRIEYLKKAKATWLAQKKRGDGEAEKAQPQPPCFRCRRPTGSDDPASCSICQVAVAHGIREEAVVYCSEDCLRLGHERHVAQEHQCAAGERCITLYQPDEGQGSTDPSDDTGDVYICKECLERRKTVVVFCTVACADANFNRHRRGAHPSFAGRLVSDDYDSRTHLVTTERALRDMQEKQVIDELEFVRELPPAVGPRKPEVAGTSNARGHVDRGGNHPSHTQPRAETSFSDRMDLDGANERDLDAASAAPPGALSIRHNGERRADEKMSGTETQPAPEPAHDRHTTDTEMIDAVDATDFADQPGPPQPASAPTDHRAAPEGNSPSSPRARSSKPTVPSPDSSPGAANSSPAAPPNNSAGASSSEHPSPRSSPHPRTTNMTEHLPLDHPQAAAAASQPSATTITSPDRITSIEPMPSLGRSLEIEIAKIPAGAEAAFSSSSSGGNTPAAGAGPSSGGEGQQQEGQQEEGQEEEEKEVVARQRSRALENMDRIADGKKERIGETADKMGLTSQIEDKDGWDESAEGKRRKKEEQEQQDILMTGGHETRQESGATHGGPDTASEIRPGRSWSGSSSASRKASVSEARRDSGGGETSAVAAEDSLLVSHGAAREELTTATKLAARPAEGGEAGKAPPDKEQPEAEPASQKSAADGREEGEISDDSGKKRKADSAEPGEVKEVEGEAGREGKKAKSEEADDSGNASHQ